MPGLALSELLGVPVLDPAGAVGGRVREVAVAPQEDTASVACLIVKTASGDRMLGRDVLAAVGGGTVRAAALAADWPPFVGGEGLLLLERDLLDQQIIDVHGRKVVRVNDVDLYPELINQLVVLRIGEVDVGARGAVRRLLKGVVPARALRLLLAKIPQHAIPWEFVDLIETDPARRVKLKISHDRLAKLHPADIADILEELAPAEREAVFETLDEEVAAGALEEIEPKLQVSIMESLDSDRAADIMEEMNPAAAADLLGDLSEETSEEILEEMQPAEREEVSELLEFKENTAAGRMTTDYLYFASSATVEDAIQALGSYEGAPETLSAVYVVDHDEKLVGAVSLASLAMAREETQLSALITQPVISCPAGAGEKDVVELFDKYNLLSLPVVDEQGRLSGVITADVVINLLRSKL
ncbi:MAG TPA: CBS domain-containing protein [Terriglobales bacterium]|nr:CBS domain-containing protein [Terriglobales bacterium]